ncbi:helicase-associated domain-containing protein [Kocuria sp.]|uniref:helicase-associated domain-containing protein n=1 Tax=Kocuria sp. TaxID=1871328 RepID=UPI0026DFEC59|nr:helicase-associated domain-containing protein [Kocuria sp.]MDO5619526.1 helicase-associated domain-containing protein [Kocuria sp.]
MAELAAQLSTRASVHAAIQELNRAQLDALERAVILGSHTLSQDRATASLHDLALVYPTEDSWRLAPEVGAGLGRYPAGLGRPYSVLATTRDSDSPAVPAPPRATPDLSLLADTPERPAEILAEFASRPLGFLRNARREPIAHDPQNHPVDWLLAHRLLVPVDGQHVEVPREVGLALHGGDPWAQHAPAVPQHNGAAVKPLIRDNAALAAIPELVRDLTEVRLALGQRPVDPLRDGGIGVRERRRLTAELELPGERVDLLLGYAFLGGLIHPSDADGSWRPAPVPWEALGLADAYGVLLSAWWGSRCLPSSVGTHRRDGSVVAPLMESSQVTEAPALRAAVLLALSQAKDGAPSPQWVLEAATWLRPRLAPLLTRYGPGLLQECADLGLTGAGAPTDTLQELLTSGPQAAARTVAQHLPPASTSVMAQGDHTAVSPGPLAPATAALLRLVADSEGRGPAATFRFTVGSLQRGLAAGYHTGDLRQILQQLLGGSVPPWLENLLEEAQRTHGALRIHTAHRVVTGRADLVEVMARSLESQQYHAVRVAPEILILTPRASSSSAAASRSHARRDPLDTALFKAAEKAGIQPTTASTDYRPLREITGPLAELMELIPPGAPASSSVDPEHVSTVAERLARAGGGSDV